MHLRLEQRDDQAAVRALHLVAAFGDHGRVVADLVDELRQSVTSTEGVSSLPSALAEVVLVEVVTVELVLEPPCVERATTTSRPSKTCELGLEAKQRITPSLMLVVSTLARLPWSAAIVVECLRRPVRVLKHDLGAVVEAARIRHEQVSVAVSVPVRLRDVAQGRATPRAPRRCTGTHGS